MQIELTREQYRELVHTILAGTYVREAVEEWQGSPDWERLGKLEEYILSFAGQFASEDMVQRVDGEWIPTTEVTDQMENTIDEYNDIEFWDQLSSRLGQRDAERTMTSQERRELETMGQYPDRVYDFFNKWTEEFEEHGVDRLEVKE